MDTVRDQRRSHLEHVSAQISEVLDPLAMRCRGRPVEAIRPLVAQAWRREFRCELGEPALSDTAAAVHDGRPRSEALWSTGW
ncbi:MAG: hypothetical protein L0I76_28935 [Pseudonocardia sp.]|nr:hypothetical protein [Pseudonocardia sp.]